jgi:hypothetical protein
MSAARHRKDRRGIHLIAELANVSIGTVDRALHGRAGISESGSDAGRNLRQYGQLPSPVPSPRRPRRCRKNQAHNHGSFAEMSPYFEKRTITASIYQQPHRQGQMAVRLMADNLTGRVPFPPTVHLSPGVVMSSNLHLLREIRLAGVKFDDSAIGCPSRARTASRFHLRDKTQAVG